LEQDYPNLEYIIIDGGSTDNSLEIIKKYQEKLTYWVSENDQGMYDALQKGFEKSTGEIMAWINADDLYHRKSFFIVAEIFSKFTDVNWLVGASTIWDEYDRGIDVYQSRKFSRYDFLIGDYKFIEQESCFFRRILWEKAGSYIDKSLKYAGDFELWLRFFRHDKLYVVNALIGGFRMKSADQLSLEGMPKYLKEAKKILKSEKINDKERYKIIRYKFIFSVLGFFYHFLERLMNKYRKIEFGLATKSIIFNRFTQQFKMK
jgi:glycosyltransferase involved in cell wall biosynthesis